MTLNTEKAKLFNVALKNAIKIISNEKVKVRIINSYKFPDCYVEVVSDNKFENNFRLEIFDAFGFSRTGLINDKDVSYGNIQSNHITGKVFQWVNFINSKNGII